MGLGDLFFNGVVELFAVVLVISATSGWLRAKRRRYLVLAAVSFLVGVGWAVSMASGPILPGTWGCTLVWLNVCAILLVSFRRSDRASGGAVSKTADNEDTGEDIH